MKKILLSGIQPSGRPHIGNYFGAMKQFVELQDTHECFIFIADYHALTTVQKAAELRENIINVAIDYLAVGLDPAKITLYKQSDIPEHTELAWIFECLTSVSYLERAHAFKDAQARRSEVNAGTFNYPLLMAADILLYDTDVVPVGQDQKQHVEIARDTAEKFNRVFGDLPAAHGTAQAGTFKLPEPLILDKVKVVPGIDGQKMSKSYGNTIPLFAEDAEIERLVMSIVTDSSDGIPKNVYEIHKLFRPESELVPLYQSKAGKYKELKEALIDDMKKFLAPLRWKRKEVAKDINVAIDVLKKGGEKAKAIAVQKMEQVRKAIGVEISYPVSEKDFDRWNTKKKQTHFAEKELIFYEREVWWCSFGVNIGVEIDGRHEHFLRPAIVMRKFNKDMALVVPTTAKEKKGKYYLSVSGEDKKDYTVCVSQLRTISAKRLLRKIGTVTKNDYDKLIKRVVEMTKGEL